MTYAVFAKNCFCPDHTWQVVFVGDTDDCLAEADSLGPNSDSSNQGVPCHIGDRRDLNLWDSVKGGRFAPISFPAYILVEKAN